MVIHSFRTVDGTVYLLLVMVEKGITIIIIIIIINIKDWTLWPVPSPQLQLLAPMLLPSSCCSPSLLSVVVWFHRLCGILCKWRSQFRLYSAENWPKLTWLWQYSHQPWSEWRPKLFTKQTLSLKWRCHYSLYVSNWLKLHVLHSHHNGSPWQVYSRTCHRSCWEGRVACQHCQQTLRSSHVYSKGMAKEIPEGSASWKA